LWFALEFYTLNKEGKQIMDFWKSIGELNEQQVSRKYSESQSVSIIDLLGREKRQ
jgi:hypothetical protein